MLEEIEALEDEVTAERQRVLVQEKHLRRLEDERIELDCQAQVFAEQYVVEEIMVDSLKEQIEYEKAMIKLES